MTDASYYMIPPKFAALGLTYDDVLLLPAASDVVPSEVDTTYPADPRDHGCGSRCSRPRWTPSPSRGWRSRWPARAASASCTATCRSRTRPHQVDLVKRSESGMVTDPVTVGPDATLAELDELCGEYRVSACRSSTTDGRLLGIITNRDMRFVPVDDSRPPGPRGDDADAAGHRAGRHRPRGGARAAAPSTRSRSCRSSTPTAGSRGLITVKDFVKTEQYPNATKDAEGRLRVGAAIGFFGDAWERATRPRRRRRGRARRRHRPRPRPAAARHGAPAQVATRRPARRRSSAATSPPGPAPRRWSTRAPTRSRWASGRARSAPPASSPVSASRRSPRSTRPPRPAGRRACRSSATAACSTPATSPRRSSPAPTR